MAYNIHIGLHPQPKRVLFAWLERQTGMRVSQGPFKGMKLANATFAYVKLFHMPDPTVPWLEPIFNSMPKHTLLVMASDALNES